MKTMLLAAAAAMSLGIGSAYAADSARPAGGYVYPDYIFQGTVYGGVVQDAPSAAPAERANHPHLRHPFAAPGRLAVPTPSGGRRLATN